MANPAVASLLSDLRGVTVRNTFLEFEEGQLRHLDGDSGFLRQVSEPAKPFSVQVSDQTTSGSRCYGSDSPSDPEETCQQQTPYLGATSPSPPVPGPAGALGHGPPGDMSSGMLQAFHAAPGAAAPMPPQAQVRMHFCPNCGAEAEPSHRFCPFCCYALQPGAGGGTGGAGGGAGGGGAWQQPSPQGLPADAFAASRASPSLLGSLRRFRYVEACASDVDLARVLCINHLQAGRAA